jgi:hypothetical protein
LGAGLVGPAKICPRTNLVLVVIEVGVKRGSTPLKNFSGEGRKKEVKLVAPTGIDPVT